MHENVGLYQSYIKNLRYEESHCENDQRKREISREISSVTRKMTDRYSSNPNSKLFSKALAVQKSPEPSAAKHTAELNELFKQSFEQIDSLNPDTAIFVAETFFMAERFSDGDEMVNKYKARFKDRPEVVKQLSDLQAEPVSLDSRQKAKELNIKGIGLYKEKLYSESIVCFRHAMDLSPRHPGIILNFVQSHILKMKNTQVDSDEVNLCLDYINRLNYLPEDHYQFERFSKLKSNLVALK
jgi:hypothetical protein